MDQWKGLEIESPDIGYSEQVGPEVTDCDILFPLYLGFCAFVNPGKARQGVISYGFLEVPSSALPFPVPFAGK